jgi:hypothetical protein
MRYLDTFKNKTDRTRSSTTDVLVIDDAPSGAEWIGVPPENEPDETTSVQGLYVMPVGIFGISDKPSQIDKALRGITEVIFVDDPLLLQKIKEKDAIIQELISELKEVRIFESDDLDLPDDYLESNS